MLVFLVIADIIQLDIEEFAKECSKSKVCYEY